MNSKKLWIVALFLIALLSAGCADDVPGSPIKSNPDTKTVDNTQPGTGTTVQEKMQITVYYATKDARYLVPEVHEVPKNSHPAQTSMELLAVAPQNASLTGVFPSGTKVRGISVKDHVAYVDFNEAIIKNNIGGSASESLLVGAIVNTLTEFSDIHKVQILVEGKKVETLTGHMDVSEPLSRSEKIIKK
jgi:spore germination protein GerM